MANIVNNQQTTKHFETQNTKGSLDDLDKAMNINSLEEADSFLAAIAKHKRRIALVENALNEDIAALTHKVNASVREDKKAIARLEKALENYATSIKDTLFAEKCCCSLTFGIFGFRSLQPMESCFLPHFAPRSNVKGKKVFLMDHDTLPCLQTELGQCACICNKKELFFYELSIKNLENQ